MKFQTGSRVEVQAFSTVTKTVEFLPGEVSDVAPCEGGLSDVFVQTDEGFVKVVRVGKRGGSTQIRLA
jgi:hypothetical protein